MVGVILAMFETGVLVTSPIVSMLLERTGRKNFVILGNIAAILASMGFGMMVYVKNDITFFVLSMLLRFI